jgi:hypothetical protein
VLTQKPAKKALPTTLDACSIDYFREIKTESRKVSFLEAGKSG